MDKNLLRELKKGVVFIEVERSTPVDCESYGTFHGTGFLMAEPVTGKRMVVTCKHLASLSCKSVFVEFDDGSKIRGKVVYNDHAHDIAFIEVEEAGQVADWIPVETENHVETFEVVTLIGCNEGYKSFAVSGIVAETHCLLNPRDTLGIQTNLACSHGTSGSPVFNDLGKIIGMHIQGSEKCSFEIRIEVILDVLKKFVTGTARKESGLTFVLVNKHVMQNAGLLQKSDAEKYFPTQNYVLAVKDVDQLYPASKKLLPGDIILSAGGSLVRNPFEVQKLIDSSRDEEVEIFYVRLGEIGKCRIRTLPGEKELTKNILSWEEGTFQESNIMTRRYLGIREEGVLLSKATHSSPFSNIGMYSQHMTMGKGALLTHVDGVRVTKLEDLIEVIANSTTGTIVLHYFDFMSLGLLQMHVCQIQSRNFQSIKFYKEET